MKIFKPVENMLSEVEILEISEILKKGGIMIYPTETVYGIGCNAFDQKKVDLVYKLKNRSDSQKSSVMVDSVETIEKYVKVGGLEREFISKNLPGPVTIVLRLKDKYRDVFAKQVVNDCGGVGFRIVKDFVYLKQICEYCDFPILSTSANKSGVSIERSSSEFAMSFFKDEIDSIDVLIDAGDLGENSPSAVVDITKIPYQIIRRGNFNE